MTFDSDDASRRQSTSSNIYSWQNATLDWSAGDDISVALLSEAMAAARPANSEATGAPSISGSPTVGQTLTAATTGIPRFQRDELCSVTVSVALERRDQ